MATRTALGTATNKAGGGHTWAPSELSNITIDPNHTLIVRLAAINAVGWAFACRFPTSGDNVPADVFPDGVSPRLNVFRYRNLTANPVTGDISFFTPTENFTEAFAACAVKYDVLLGRDATAEGENATGNTTPDSGNAITATATAQVLAGVFAVQGPGGDGAPTVTAGAEADNLGQRAGTTGGSATSNCTIVETYGEISSDADCNAAITLATSRGWMAQIIRYTVLPPGSAGPYDDVHCIG